MCDGEVSSWNFCSGCSASCRASTCAPTSLPTTISSVWPEMNAWITEL